MLDSQGNGHMWWRRWWPTYGCVRKRQEWTNHCCHEWLNEQKPESRSILCWRCTEHICGAGASWMLQQLENLWQGSASFPASPCSAHLLRACACCSADMRGHLLGEQQRSARGHQLSGHSTMCWCCQLAFQHDLFVSREWNCGWDCSNMFEMSVKMPLYMCSFVRKCCIWIRTSLCSNKPCLDWKPQRGFCLTPMKQRDDPCSHR